MAGNNVLTLTDDNFDIDVLQADIPVLVDFWAEWCMPCRMIAPTLEELAGEYAGKVKIGRVDTDNNREAAGRFGITAIPTIILFTGGQVARKFVGLTSKKDFKTALDEAV